MTIKPPSHIEWTTEDDEADTLRPPPAPDLETPTPIPLLAHRDGVLVLLKPLVVVIVPTPNGSGDDTTAVFLRVPEGTKIPLGTNPREYRAALVLQHYMAISPEKVGYWVSRLMQEDEEG